MDAQATSPSRDASVSFADLHRPGQPFVLPNAWDLASARLLAEARFPAIGTTSLGIAAAHGLIDGSRATRDATVRLARDLTAARLGAYVTVDAEDGFSDDPAAVAALVAQLGVDGVNIEDSTAGELIDPRRAARKIAAIRAAAPTVFVNARTDVYWLGGTDLGDALDRLRAYTDAGADGVFVPGTADPQVIETITTRIPLPLNVLATQERTPDQLGELGVARISTGSLLYRAALSAALDTAAAARGGQSFRPPISYQRVQELASL